MAYFEMVKICSICQVKQVLSKFWLVVGLKWPYEKRMGWLQESFYLRLIGWFR